MIENEILIPKTAASLPNPEKIENKTTAFSLHCVNKSKIPLEVKTSLRYDKYEENDIIRCLVIGRQASISDIRIDHKSISRKHAALYYEKSDKTEGDLFLFLKDLGGKKGCFRNGIRVEANSTVQLNQNDILQFGNCELKFVIEKTQIKKEIRETENSNNNDKENIEENKTTRADREREINAAISSLDQAPTYKKVEIPIQEHSQGKNVGKIPSTIPLSEKIKINVCKPKALTSLAIDPSGARFIAGSSLDNISLFDFGGMDSHTYSAFKLVQVEEGHAIQDIAFSPSGDKFIVASASATPVVYDRNGEEVKTFVKGDVYVTDMAHTSGHVAQVNTVQFHPFEKDIILTSSMDGSVRVWDLKYKTAFGKLISWKVLRIKNEQGKKTAATCASYHPAGKFIVVGTLCGSIQIWKDSPNSNNPPNRPNVSNWSEHENKTITCIVWNTNGTRIATRAANHSKVYIWDVYSPLRIRLVSSISNVPNDFSQRNNCVFSPDKANTYIVLATTEGTSKSSFLSQIRVYDVLTASLKYQCELEKAHIPVQIFWNNRINQIFITMSNGELLLHYNSEISQKGILLTKSRPSNQIRDDLDLLLEKRASTAIPYENQILTPFSTTTNNKRKKFDDYDGMQENTIPEKPAPKGIKTGSENSSGFNFTQMIVQNQISKTQYLSASRDPRETLFQYIDKGRDFGTVMEGALAKKTVEQEEEEMKKSK